MGKRLRALRRRDGLETSAGPDFDTLFRSCVGDVHAYAMSMLGDRAAAEDVTALAFERLYRARDRVDPRRGSARGIAVHDRAQRRPR